MADAVGPGSINKAANKDWLDQLHEDVLDPDRTIIDPHHHLHARPHHNYLIDDLAEDINNGHNIRATVFIDCAFNYRKDGPAAMAPVGEVEAVAAVARQSETGNYGPAQLCAGIVGYAELTLGDAVEEVLDAQIEAGGGRFRGIRCISKWDPDARLRTGRRIIPQNLLGQPEVRKAFAKLQPRGLSFDSWLFHPQLQNLIDLARAFPDTEIIMDHVGGLVVASDVYANRREEQFTLWRRLITDLSKCPNVCIKLGGLAMPVMGLGLQKLPKPLPSEQLAALWRPYIEPCIDAFGPGRCMFESNFPPDKQSCSYPVLWNAFKRLAELYSPSEKHAMFFGTAKRVYRLSV